jgi:hypothetical protein
MIKDHWFTYAAGGVLLVQICAQKTAALEPLPAPAPGQRLQPIAQLPPTRHRHAIPDPLLTTEQAAPFHGQPIAQALGEIAGVDPVGHVGLWKPHKADRSGR